MPSGRSNLPTAKSLPELHRPRTMPIAGNVVPKTSVKPILKTTPRFLHKNARKPPILPYREDQYSSKVLVGTWEERRTTDHLPKVPFQDAYMLDAVDGDPNHATAKRTTETTTYQKNYLRGRERMDEAVNNSYQAGRTERIKNKTSFDSEAKEDVYRPEKDTSLYDQGAAWQSLYHQSYILKIPKTTADEAHHAAIGAPEMKYGLWEKHLAKWAKIEADSNVLWKSTYQMGYPVRVRDQSVPASERRCLQSQWRTQEGNLVIGNPHLEAQKELDPSVYNRHERPPVAHQNKYSQYNR